jgi:hypothetical protein
MISSQEMGYLYWLGSQVWSGKGGIVEIGPWLGGSTWCLASGAKANPRYTGGRPLTVVDSFRWRPFMASRAALDLDEDASFREHFEANLAPKSDLIQVVEAMLPDDRSADLVHADPVRPGIAARVPLLSEDDLPDEVSIAFVDGAKSWLGLVSLLKMLLPRCAVGETYLVFQDYQCWSTYWVGMMVGYLHDIAPNALSLSHVLDWNSVCFRLESEIPMSAIAALPATIDDMGVAEGTRSLEIAVELLASNGYRSGAAIAGLGIPTFLGAKGEWDEAVARFRIAERTWPRKASVTQLEATRNWLRRHTGESLPESWLLRTARVPQRVRRLPRRVRALVKPRRS